MNTTTLRFNITLPLELGLRLKTAKNRSQLVAESLTETFARQEAEQLAIDLAKGYAARARADLALNQEFDQAIGDGLE